MVSYYAVFDDGQQLRHVGPFHDTAKADTYGTARQGDQFDYLGWSELTESAEFDQLAGVESIDANTRENGWHGVVTRWDDEATHGFITDSDGRSWFVSRDDLPDGLDRLEIGVYVWFVGSPNPRPGKKYPQAYGIRITVSGGS